MPRLIAVLNLSEPPRLRQDFKKWRSRKIAINMTARVSINYFRFTRQGESPNSPSSVTASAVVLARPPLGRPYISEGNLGRKPFYIQALLKTRKCIDDTWTQKWPTCTGGVELLLPRTFLPPLCLAILGLQAQPPWHAYKIHNCLVRVNIRSDSPPLINSRFNIYYPVPTSPSGIVIDFPCQSTTFTPCPANL